jgi:hypothetical protein
MEKYFKFLDDFCQYDYSMFAKYHKSRAYTFKYLWHEMIKIDNPIIVELGTTRSFVHGGNEGCMVFDEKYWFPDKPELWDWSAGCFSRVFAELPNKEFYTVDINPKHIWVSKTMTKEFEGIGYYVSDSVQFLKDLSNDFGILDKQCDLIYLDTGDMHPLEQTARLHEQEAKIIIENELVKIGGYILMDDVRNPVPCTQFGEKSRFGKDKYSIGIFLANGYDIIMDEYQLILKRIA